MPGQDTSLPPHDSRKKPIANHSAFDFWILDLAGEAEFTQPLP